MLLASGRAWLDLNRRPGDQETFRTAISLAVDTGCITSAFRLSIARLPPPVSQVFLTSVASALPSRAFPSFAFVRAPTALSFSLTSLVPTAILSPDVAKIYVFRRTSTLALRQLKAALARQLDVPDDLLRASYVERFTTCGKPNCARGHRHGPIYYLTANLGPGHITKLLIKTPAQQPPRPPGRRRSSGAVGAAGRTLANQDRTAPPGRTARPLKRPDFAELSHFVTSAKKRFHLPLLAGCCADARPQPHIPSRAGGLSLLLGASGRGRVNVAASRVRGLRNSVRNLFSQSASTHEHEPATIIAEPGWAKPAHVAWHQGFGRLPADDETLDFDWDSRGPCCSHRRGDDAENYHRSPRRQRLPARAYSSRKSLGARHGGGLPRTGSGVEQGRHSGGAARHRH